MLRRRRGYGSIRDGSRRGPRRHAARARARRSIPPRYAHRISALPGAPAARRYMQVARSSPRAAARGSSCAQPAPPSSPAFARRRSLVRRQGRAPPDGPCIPATTRPALRASRNRSRKKRQYCCPQCRAPRKSMRVVRETRATLPRWCRYDETGTGRNGVRPRDDLPISQPAPVCRRAPPPRRPDGPRATSHRPAVPLSLISKPSHLLFAAAPSTHFLPMKEGSGGLGRPSYGAPHRYANRAKSVAIQQAHEPLLDFADEPRAAIDEAGVELDHARAGANMSIRVFRGCDPAYADNRKTALRIPVNLPDNFARALRQRLAAEPAFEGRGDPNLFTLERRVGRDDSVEREINRGHAYFTQLTLLEVGRKFHH